MSGDAVIWFAGILCTVLFIVALFLPPDKPKHGSDCK